MLFKKTPQQYGERVKTKYLKQIGETLKELKKYLLDYNPEEIKGFALEYAYQTCRYEDVDERSTPGFLEFLIADKLREILRETRVFTEHFERKLPLTLELDLVKRSVYYDHSGRLRYPKFYLLFFESNPEMKRYNLLTQTPKEIREITGGDIDNVVLATEIKEFTEQKNKQLIYDLTKRFKKKQ